MLIKIYVYRNITTFRVMWTTIKVRVLLQTQITCIYIRTYGKEKGKNTSRVYLCNKQ